MSQPADDIRDDFLAEAGELVERLGPRLLDLERNPQDAAILNDVFRVFHTVKGGAGFLGLESLVALCHAAEDVFDALRKGRRTLDASSMDAVLASVDGVQAMLDALSAAQPLPAADPSLLRALRDFATGDAPPTQTDANGGTEAVPSAHAAAKTPSGPARPARKPRGKGPKAAAPKAAEPATEPVASTPGAAISDDEFEALLDALHGSGKAPGTEPVTAAAPSAGLSVSVPADEKVDERVAAPAAPVASLSRTPQAPQPSVPAAVAPRAETTLRVDTERLDQLMNLAGELVLIRNRLKDMAARGEFGDQASRALAELDLVTRNLQNAVMKVRMQPVGRVFSRFPKIVRDLSRALGKKVEISLHGEDTDLDKNLVEALADPLVHMVRNSLDHGIEQPGQRLARGKPEVGQLSLSAEQHGDHIQIRLRDDGAGIDPERVRRSAVEKGVLSAEQAAVLSTDECVQLIFAPGFSTREEVSDVSGRGVGMDVVVSRIRALNGQVKVDSVVGAGTTVTIRVPLTLAILPALMVRAGDRVFALPLASVVEVFELDESRIDRMDRWHALLTPREILRLVYAEPWLKPVSDPMPRHVVVMQVGDERYGLVVREVIGREEVVIKPLGSALRGLPGIAAATVLPNGRVALILEAGGVVAAQRAALQRQPDPILASADDAHG